MCGKFVQLLAWREARYYEELLDPSPGAPEVAATALATPMRFAQVICLDQAGKRRVLPMRWGFAGRKDDNPGSPAHMHARGETIDRLPTFASAFREGRGLVAVQSFNVGQEVSATRVVQHILTPKDGMPLAIAVIYEKWTDGQGRELYTFVMATTPPNALVATVTDRMPAVIAPELWTKWLGEEPATPEELKAILTPYAGGLDMRAQDRASKKPPLAHPDLFAGL